MSNVCCLLWFFLIGCSLNPAGLQPFGSKSLQKNDKALFIDPDNGPYTIEVNKNRDGTLSYFWDIDSRIELAQTCRVKYHSLWNSARFMVIEGAIGHQKNTYPVVLDTGASQAIFVKKKHIQDNKLAIYPIETEQFKAFNFGLCHLPELKLGNISLFNWPCFYLHRRGQLSFFGMSLNQDNAIILGLPALREFKYVAFDSIKEQVEFSAHKTFEPQQRQLWLQYPISIEQDFHGNAFLFVEMTVAGESIELQLDTGSGNGLAIGQEILEKIRHNVPGLRLKKAKEFYPYIGRLSCRKAVIPALEFGGRTIENAKVSVFPDDSVLLEECGALVGMQYFRDTVMVLDFESELLWVKKQ